jgi:zinc D-Ala-D-Ala dipeptidase
MYKLTNRFYIKIFCGLIFSTFTFNVTAQDTLLNKYGLWVINRAADFKKTVQSNSQKQLIDLKQLIPGICVALQYAGNDNFMGKSLYPASARAYLRQPAAHALAAVQKELNGRGLGLKIYDAYRPYSVTEAMWEPVKDDRYAANPNNGSGHNRGVAVDLTIINLQTNEVLDMGTGFDNFSDTAHHRFTALPAAVLANRQLLKTLMEQHGFKALETEWWHYALPNAPMYELLDLHFDTLQKISSRKK